MALKTSQVNLLPEELRETKKLRFARKILKQGSFSLLALYLLGILLLSFAYFLFLREERKLGQVNTQLKARVESFRKEEANLVVIKDRLGLARGVFAKASSFPEDIIDESLSLFPSSTKILGIKAGEGEVSLNAVAPTLADLSRILRAFEASRFKEVVLGNLSLSAKDGGYSLSLDIR